MLCTRIAAAYGCEEVPYEKEKENGVREGPVRPDDCGAPVVPQLGLDSGDPCGR